MSKEEIDVQERLMQIDKKLETIDGKLSEKWFLPVFITVLTAILGGLGFLIERNLIKSDVADNKGSEIIGAFIAQSKVDFYTACKSHLIKIDEQFEAYCKFDQAGEEEDRLDTLVLEFRNFTSKQQVIDQVVLESVKNYSEFIAEKTFDISTGVVAKKDIPGMYQDSRSFLNQANKHLDDGIKTFIKR